MNSNSIAKEIEKQTGLKRSTKEKKYAQECGRGNICYAYRFAGYRYHGDFHVEKYYGTEHRVYCDSDEAINRISDIESVIKGLGLETLSVGLDLIQFKIPKDENKWYGSNGWYTKGPWCLHDYGGNNYYLTNCDNESYRQQIIAYDPYQAKYNADSYIEKYNNGEIVSRRTFEEGDNVIVKGVERKGTVDKKRGDFYNVTLDATGEKKEKNVFGGDMVKASKTIKSAKSEDEFDEAVAAISDFFEVNPNGNIVKVGREITDIDYENGLDDICRKYNVSLRRSKCNTDNYFVINSSRQINSMAIKTLEKYYKDGMLTKKEVIAILMKENGWEYPMAKQAADFYERVFTAVNSSKQIKSGALDWIDRERKYILDLGNTFARTKKAGVPCEREISDGGASYNLFFNDGIILYIHYGTDLWVGVVIKGKGRKDVKMTHNLKEDCDIIENALKSITSSKQLTSRFYQNGNNNLYTLSEAAQYLSALFFDLRTIHFLTTGSEFYTYHELAQKLYEQTEEYYDDTVETAIGFDSDVSPMYVLPGDWQFVDENGSLSTDGKVTQTLILDKIQKIYDVLENVQDYGSMVQSKIDSMLEFYDKEIYKLRQALK